MTVLVLAGTAEARELLAAIPTDRDVIASLAGATRSPDDLGHRTRVGGFGGAEGFAAFLSENNVAAVIDATHPFAAQMTATAAEVCEKSGVPYLRLQRPAWTPEAGDNWHFVNRIVDLGALIPPNSTVFLATGRQTLSEYEALNGRHLIARVIDPPNRPFPLPNGRFEVGKPPFSVEEEVALFQRENIDWLVVKNAGGQASRSKLVAARELNLPVALINRPPLPAGVNVVETTEAALILLNRTLSDG